MPRTAGNPISPTMSPAMQAACARINREMDPWFLPNLRMSIMGDAAIYVANSRIREASLTAIGIKARDHLAVREALRAQMMCERRSAIALQRLASMLVGERRLAREGTQTIARRFAARAA